MLVETARSSEDYAGESRSIDAPIGESFLTWSAASHAWNTDAGTLHNDAWPLQMIFHSYDPVMAITDDTDNVWCVTTVCRARDPG